MDSVAGTGGRRLRAGALSFWVEQSGSGPPLLLIAGLGYASWCWLDLRRQLTRDATATVFDNRGTGRSDKPDGPYSIELLADDAAAILDALDLAGAHVLGHSMGGYIAQTLALRHPRKVRSLILVGTGRGGAEAQAMPEDTVKAWESARTLLPAEYARRTMPNSFAPGWTEAHPREFDSILARRLQYPTPTANWLAQYQACADYFVRGIDVTQIRVPTSVIHGELDRVVPNRNGLLIAQRLPGAKFVSLPRAGHLPMLENPREFAQLVRNHLEALR